VDNRRKHEETKLRLERSEGLTVGKMSLVIFRTVTLTNPEDGVRMFLRNDGKRNRQQNISLRHVGENLEAAWKQGSAEWRSIQLVAVCERLAQRVVRS
jgi:hypothetical protein